MWSHVLLHTQVDDAHIWYLPPLLVAVRIVQWLLHIWRRPVTVGGLSGTARGRNSCSNETGIGA